MNDADVASDMLAQRAEDMAKDLLLIEQAITTGQKSVKKILAQNALARIRTRLGIGAK